MDNAPFHHSQIIPELMENAGCELWYLPNYSRLFQPHRGSKKLRLQFEKSYLNTTFMFIEPPMRFFRSCKYFAAHCCNLTEIHPLLEEVVKMVVLSSLLELAGFYQSPCEIETETSIAIVAEDDDITVREVLMF